ncbi:hypothetical protein CYLTODRAFT_400695 [Cylindrobasidium torrendii FP15055 ss-10]|uniref:GATA-type domain-containing protein n=1 Tax=Cylindrobasidium torrendii FP15055 ss-10 TaxID=1314674 RepID=A0A0D7B522_9AGAR|nr:hypothetical protein CYLTODRAFT_400695 [Cylindrobasidium torrendii FP15055 ss-10]
MPFHTWDMIPQPHSMPLSRSQGSILDFTGFDQNNLYGPGVVPFHHDWTPAPRRHSMPYSSMGHSTSAQMYHQTRTPFVHDDFCPQIPAYQPSRLISSLRTSQQWSDPQWSSTNGAPPRAWSLESDQGLHSMILPTPRPPPDFDIPHLVAGLVSTPKPTSWDSWMFSEDIKPDISQLDTLLPIPSSSSSSSHHSPPSPATSLLHSPVSTSSSLAAAPPSTTKPARSSSSGVKRTKAPSVREPKVKACTHCKATTTPLWRRDPSTGNTLCNACGLYLQQRHKLRPQVLIDADVDDESEEEEGSTSGPECSHCHTRRTSVWRRNKAGEQLCNACGVYLRLRGKERPLSLKRNKIKPRTKHK